MSPKSLNPVEQNERLQTITEVLVEALPPGWMNASIEYRSMGRYVEYAAGIRVDGGPMQLWEPPDVWVPFTDLRWGMYLHDKGTWNSARYDLEHPDRYSIRYNRDEPKWSVGPSAQAYEEELRFFPRAPENIPDWFRQQHAQAVSK
jgi:hypothetical protein